MKMQTFKPDQSGQSAWLSTRTAAQVIEATVVSYNGRMEMSQHYGLDQKRTATPDFKIN